MGGIKSKKMNGFAKNIWEWYISRDIWIFVDHIPGRFNIADVESRKFDDNIEWKLDITVFDRLVGLWGKPDFDLFATRLNTQLQRFSSWKPDPESELVNAFSFIWNQLFYYIFPPFSLISRCVQKYREIRPKF